MLSFADFWISVSTIYGSKEGHGFPYPEKTLRLGQPSCHWFVNTNEPSMRPCRLIVLLIPGELAVHNHFRNNNKSSSCPCPFKVIQVNNAQSSFDSRIEPETKTQRDKPLRMGR